MQVKILQYYTESLALLIGMSETLFKENIGQQKVFVWQYSTCHSVEQRMLHKLCLHLIHTGHYLQYLTNYISTVLALQWEADAC